MKGMSRDSLSRLNDLVVADPDVMHGALCFRGTRVPVELLLNDLKTGHTIDDFLTGCPTVGRDQVEAYFQLAQELVQECAVS